MIRTKVKNQKEIIEEVPSSLILTSDWHLREREDQPECRMDSYWAAQWKKIDYISRLQKKYHCPVIHAGDLFDYWKPSPHLLSETIKHIPKDFRTVYGQHDLPQHNIELAYKCGIETLVRAGKVELLPEVHFGMLPKYGSLLFPNSHSGRMIVVWHFLTYIGRKPFPNCTSPYSADILLKKYSKFDLIVTGDNHQAFAINNEKGRWLVNPGSLMRMTAAQVNHKPCIYFWYKETNSVKVHFIPVEKGVISREHIENKESRDKRIEAFISRLDTEWESNISFEENLKRFEEKNQVRKSVMNIVRKAIENE